MNINLIDITIILAILKLVGVLPLGWLWVLCPIWIPLLITLIIALLVLLKAIIDAH